jgi:hypothetical protein
MEDSAYNSLMLGVYVFVFITAISLTIYLFSSTVSLSDNAFNYGKVTTGDSIIETTSAPKYNTVTGSELLTYYYNYISTDKYSTPVDVPYDFKNIQDIQINKTYTLIYESANTGVKPVITVVEVASEQSADLGTPIVVDKKPTDPIITTFPYISLKSLPNSRVEVRAESQATYSVLTNFIKSYYWRIDYSPEDGRADFTTTTLGQTSQLRNIDFGSNIEFRAGINTIYVTAQDNLGNYSNTISRIIEVGYNDPTITSLVESTNKVYDYGTVAMESPTGVALQFVANATSNNPGGYVQKFDWYVNDVLVQSGASQRLNKNFVPGAYTLALTVTDSIQGTASKGYSFTVLNIPAPTLSCSNSSVISTQNIAITNATVNLTFDAALAAKYGITKYVWNVDGTSYETAPGAGINLNYAIGTHTVDVYGVNSEGIVSELKSFSFTVKEDYIPFEREYTTNGSYYTETLPAGKYIIETLGAQGGNGSGGYGGYAKGQLNLTSSTTLYIYVGSTAGYNGGGSSRLGYSSGGGATDVRLVGGSWNTFSSLVSRIIVAGGGAGNGGNSTTCAGGSAGGTVGYTGGDGYGSPGSGGTQTSGGLTPRAGTYGGSDGSFGLGGNAETASNTSAGAGGGGYYGGGGGSSDYPGWNDPDDSGGGGGSSFISGYSGCNAVNISGVHTGQANHYSGLTFIDSSMIQGMNTGDGKAKITRVR